jgi:hypothetical protein
MDDNPHYMGDAEVKGHTELGLWVYVYDLDEKVFVPFTQIHDNSDIWEADSEPGELVVTTYLAEKREWL